MLLDSGMNPDLQNWQGQTLLLFIGAGAKTEENRVKCAAMLLDAGASISARDDEYRSTPLGWAARGGVRSCQSHPAIAQSHLNFDAELNGGSPTNVVHTRYTRVQISLPPEVGIHTDPLSGRCILRSRNHALSLQGHGSIGAESASLQAVAPFVAHFEEECWRVRLARSWWGDGQGGRRRRNRGAPKKESRVKRLGPQIQKPRRTTCPGAALLLRYGGS